MTHTTTPAQIRRAEKTLRRLVDTITEMRHNLPEAQNSEQELAAGALLEAFDGALKAEYNLRSAARHLADKRTEAEIGAEQEELRQQERRERQMKIYGCTND